RHVAGRVLLDGEPIAGATIGTGMGSRAVTQTDGSFVLSCAPADDAELRVQGWVVLGSAVLPSGSESLEDLVVNVAPRVAVVGRGAGSYAVSAPPLHPARGEAWPHPTLARDDDTTTITVRSSYRAAARIAGHVVDDLGAPVPFARVWTGGETARTATDRAGAF